MKFVFDVESTGLTKDDEVIQFSGFLLDDTQVIKCVVNFYCYTTQPINPDAFNVHHLDKNFLWQHSVYAGSDTDSDIVIHGLTFEQQFMACKHIFDLPDITFCYYSQTNADTKLVNQTLQKMGLPPFDFGKVTTNYRDTLQKGRYSFDVMGALLRLGVVDKRQYNLSYATKCMERTFNFKVKKLFDALLKHNNISEVSSYHNALYDAFCTTVLLLKYNSRM